VARRIAPLRPPKKPLVKVKVPTLTTPPILRLPALRLGPLGVVEFQRVSPGELSPINITVVREMRERGRPLVP